MTSLKLSFLICNMMILVSALSVPQSCDHMEQLHRGDLEI